MRWKRKVLWEIRDEEGGQHMHNHVAIDWSRCPQNQRIHMLCWTSLWPSVRWAQGFGSFWTDLKVCIMLWHVVIYQFLLINLMYILLSPQQQLVIIIFGLEILNFSLWFVKNSTHSCVTSGRFSSFIVLMVGKSSKVKRIRETVPCRHMGDNWACYMVTLLLDSCRKTLFNHWSQT